MSFNEKLSYTEQVVTTPTTDFPFGFEFIEGVDAVRVLVNDVDALEAGYAIRLKNSVTMELQPAVESGVVRIYRETNIDDSMYRFTAGAKFVASNIDANFNQILHSQQEVRDQFIKLRADTFITLDNFQEENLKELKAYVDGVFGMTNPNLFDGISDNMVIDEFGETQRSNNRSFRSNIQKLANDTAILQDTAITEDVFTATLATKADTSTVANLALVKADKTYVDSKLEAVSGGLLGAYATLAEAEAAAPTLPSHGIVRVTNDGVRNGDYTWNGTTLVRSDYDPRTLAGVDTDAKLDLFSYSTSYNLYNKANAIIGKRVSGIGVFVAVAGSKSTGGIPVVAGKTYTVSFENTIGVALNFAFFDSAGVGENVQGFNYTTVPEAPLKYTFVAPENAAYVVFNLIQVSGGGERLRLQLELGSEATPYREYEVVRKIKDEAIADIIDPLIKLKNYEVELVSKNLFDTAAVKANTYVTSTGTGLAPSTGWACSGFIPVVAGRTYTLSGDKSRQGLQWFTDAVNTAVVDGGYDGSTTLPLTVTAPIGAKYVVFNLQQAGGVSYSKVQFEEGSEVTTYIPYGVSNLYIDPEYILGEGTGQESVGDGYLNLANGVGYVESKSDLGIVRLNIRAYATPDHNTSAVFNFISDSVNGTTVRICGDDAAPVRMMGATVGANHGYALSVLNATSHGKTVADIGSVWSDGSAEWVIVNVPNASQLTVTNRTRNVPISSATQTLTHVLGAANTNPITIASSVGKQWYPMLKNHSVTLSVDGESVSGLDVDMRFKDHAVFTERYDLMEKNDITEWLITNRGADVLEYKAPTALTVENRYQFNPNGGCVVSANFYVHKDLSAAQDLMFTQSARLTPAVNGNILYYVPRSVGFTHEGVNYNFRQPTNVNDLGITTRIDFTADRTEVGKAVPSRLVMLNNTHGYATGYLPVLDAHPDVRNARTSKGIQISQFEAKVYPYAVDGLTTLVAGSHYSVVAYRQYFKRNVGRTASYVVDSPVGTYLYADWHSTVGVDKVKVPTKHSGKAVHVIDKSTSVGVLSGVCTDEIAVSVQSGANYLELKLGG